MSSLTMVALLVAGWFSVQVHAQTQSVKPQTVASGLENPWAMAFLPGGQILVTERAGRMRVVHANGKVSEAVMGLPAVAAVGQGGLLDVIVDSQFASNRQIYFCFSEPGQGGNSTALARARLSSDNARLENMQIIFSQTPKYASNLHFGCRIVEAAGDLLFLTLGDRFSRMQDAQTLGNHHGKVIRIYKDGSVPKDNPFVAIPGALPEIYSIGHRNAQGATLALDGQLWTHEHGPQGGDEINAPQPGRNYGWPVITYGENYGGGKIGEGLTQKTGLEQPLHYWVPSIAPSGMVFLTSERYGKAWQGSLFVGALRAQFLNRIEIKDGKVAKEERLLTDLRERIRDVRQGPDGLLYILTDNRNGAVIRLLPQP